ncbi:MAG: TlpA family protein disulfide reductase [Bdellovibrionales bacterium]
MPRQPSAQAIQTDQPVPDFSWVDINGKNGHINDFKGKTIILNFWASWCAPCIKEFPALIKAAQDNKDNVVLLALSSDIDDAAIKKFIAKQDINTKTTNIVIARDGDQNVTGGMFQTFKLPETILIAPDQTMRHKFIGADWAPEDLQQWIEKLQTAR